MARNKYNAKRCELDGIKFDSLMEMKYYQELKLRRKANEIDFIRCHPRFPIELNGAVVCQVELDFQYFDNATQKTIFVDVKGIYPPISRLKHKLFRAQYGEIVTIVRKAKR
jgi:hypothetical protein